MQGSELCRGALHLPPPLLQGCSCWGRRAIHAPWLVCDRVSITMLGQACLYMALTCAGLKDTLVGKTPAPGNARFGRSP